MSASLTASALPRVDLCPASAALPAAYFTTEDAVRGRQTHHYLALLAGGVARAAALALADDSVRELCAKIAADHVPRGEAEVALAYDVATGEARELPHVAGRDYAVGPTEIPGRCDLLCEDDGGRAGTIIDWKLARWDYDPEQARLQLAFYALAAARARGWESAAYIFGVIGDEGAIGWSPRYELDWEDLGRVAARIRRCFDRAMDERMRAADAGSAYLPDVHEGAHCRYCPGFNACPAKRAWAAAFANAPDAATLAALTPGGVGALYARLTAAERVASEVREAIRMYLQQGHAGPFGSPTGDGRVLSLDTRGSCKLTPVREPETKRRRGR